MVVNVLGITDEQAIQIAEMAYVTRAPKSVKGWRVNRDTDILKIEGDRMYVGICQNLNVFARSISSTGERKTLAVDNQYKTQELFREWGVKPVFSDRSDGIPKVIVSPHPDDIPSYGNKCNL